MNCYTSIYSSFYTLVYVWITYFHHDLTIMEYLYIKTRYS